MSLKPKWSPDSHVERVGHLVGVIDTLLRKVKHVHAQRTEASDINLSDRSKIVFDGERRTIAPERLLINYRVGIWDARSSRQREI